MHFVVSYTLNKNITYLHTYSKLTTRKIKMIMVAAADSPYRDTISMAILRLQEDGRLQMLYNKWWKNAGTCSGDEKQGEKKANSLGVANVGGTFVILVGGLAMAAAVAVLEFVWYNSKSNHRAANHEHQVFHS